ncbi:MAG: lamin tail domain-containing protein, partial [Planctomycetota bacterium]
MITEVLFDPPKGQAGDASRDGTREAIGDEFVEVSNPHDRPITIGGYVLTDRNYPGPSGFVFRFPPLRLRPGETALVFNGLKGSIAGNFGNSSRASSPSEVFGDAWVFHAANEKRSIGFANG